MEIKLKYGSVSSKVKIPDKNYIGTIKPGHIEGVKEPENEIKKALQKPIGSKRIKEKVNYDSQVVILASDVSRPSPSDILLPPILNELNKAGVNDGQIKIIFGLGVHRKQSEKEKKSLVGKEIYERIECIDHNINDCVDIGKTRRGTPVAINRKVIEADFLIVTGNLEFHYYAGFSGGAKAVAPGVSSRKTIKANHQRFLDPLAKGGQIKGNPVREDIEEIGDMVGIDFMVNAILNSQKEIVKVVAGDVTKAHRAGIDCVNEMFMVKINELADIVITSPGGYPKDIDLYQSHKAMENASLAVKDDGIIITAAACVDGMGEQHFAEALEGDMSPRELVAELEHKFVLGRHKACRIANIHLNSEIYLVSELSESRKDKLFIQNFDSVTDALKRALKVKGVNARILVMPYGVSTIPKL